MDEHNDKRMEWVNAQRAKFIMKRLRAGGLIRKDIMLEFKLSQPTASAVIARFQKEFPDCLVYDSSAKRFIPGEAFKRFGEQIGQGTMETAADAVPELLPEDLL